jgi:hypothetical protein
MASWWCSVAELQDIDPIYRGSAYTLTFNKTASVSSPGTDITGWAIITLTIRNTPTDPNVMLQKNATIVTPLTGIFTFALSHTETLSLGVGAFFYDVQRADAGSEGVLSMGVFNVVQEVLYP